MGNGSEKGQRGKKPYSNSFRSLEAIWEVLRRHASPQHPLTVREIYDHLRQLEDDPSSFTIDRVFPGERELMARLFPGVPAEDGVPTAVNAYQDGDGLHIVVETAEGQVLAREGLAVQAALPPFQAPSYSAVDKMLKAGIPFDLGTFPCRLKCVAQVRTPRGQVKLIPYEQWEDRLTEETEKKNNVPRRYYLVNALTDGEWRVFTDLVQVYPFITQGQTKKFLNVLDKLHPGRQPRPTGRYAFKRGSTAMFAVIGLLDQAIRERRKVLLRYGEYRLEKRNQRWTPVLVPRRENGELEFEPYALMWSNGNYYLVGKHRGMMNLRVDRILDVKPLEESFAPPPDFDPVEFRDRSPVMYPGEHTLVRLVCKPGMLGVLTDFFGSVPQYNPKPDGRIEASMSIAPAGVKLFALQYAGSVEVLEPESLRREIAQELEEALKTYRS